MDKKVLRFPTMPGWRKNCIRCGDKYTLPYVAATIRDGRERICVDCFIHDVRMARR